MYTSYAYTTNIGELDLTSGDGATQWNRETRSMDEKNVAIQVHGLQKAYKKLQVLKGVDFDVARGSIFALLGSNGAGKTTIVRVLTTLLKPDDGRMRVNGFDVLSQPARVRESISQPSQFAAVEQ